MASSFSAQQANTKTIFTIPYARNLDFVGREEYIQDIEKRFSGPCKTNFVAIHGLGGIGYSKLSDLCCLLLTTILQQVANGD